MEDVINLVSHCDGNGITDKDFANMINNHLTRLLHKNYNVLSIKKFYDEAFSKHHKVERFKQTVTLIRRAECTGKDT